MHFDPDSKINQLCAQGMELEGQGKKDLALQLFQQAWEEASTDLEKFTAAHYVARHQETVADKLEWDEAALNFALKLPGNEMKGIYPSLYLNIGKCFDDLGNVVAARKNYELANSYAQHLPEDGYGKMIKSGIEKALARTG